MLKFAINNAQDEMGFHTAVRNAHSHHFLTRVQEYAKWDRGEGRGPKRMPGVEQALRKGKPTRNKPARARRVEMTVRPASEAQAFCEGNVMKRCRRFGSPRRSIYLHCGSSNGPGRATQ